VSEGEKNANRGQPEIGRLSFEKGKRVLLNDVAAGTTNDMTKNLMPGRSSEG